MVLYVELLKSVLYGVVQGITEWLPISSTGHMILLDEFVRFECTPEFWNTFLVVVQLGSILAVVALYFHRLNPFSSKKDRNERVDTITLWIKIVIACIPAGALGILFDEAIERISTAVVVAVALIVYGVAFLVLERQNRRPKINTMDHLNAKTAFFIGVFQCLSLVPGTSRSGSTISVGMIWGLERSFAVTYSFILGIPAVLGAIVLEVGDAVQEGLTLPLPILLTGLISSAAFGILSIRLVQWIVRDSKWKYFGYYTLVLGIVVLVAGTIDNFSGHAIQGLLSGG